MNVGTTSEAAESAAQLIEELSVALTDARQMLEHSQDAIMVLDDDRRYLAMNRAAAALLERAPHEILGQSVEDIFDLDDSERQALHEAWALLLGQGSLRVDWPMVLRGGKEVVLDVAATASYRPGRHLTIMRDVTDTRRDQSELADREQRLRFLLEEIEHVRDAERHRMAGDIHDYSLQLQIAARLSLDVGAQLDGAGRAEMDSKSVDLLDQAIVSTRRLLQGLAPLHTEHRPLDESLAIGLQELGELHALPIVVDIDLPVHLTEHRRLVISRIVIEAATFACRHSAPSEIAVWGRIDDDGTATLRVSDDGEGSGMSFDESQADGPARVGLLLLRERVRAMDGVVDIRFVGGRGTTVTMQIPHVRTDEPAGREQ